jgi:hypothetical protein
MKKLAGPTKCCSGPTMACSQATATHYSAQYRTTVDEALAAAQS